MRATQAIIHLEGVRHNIRVIKEHVGKGVKICVAVKADAYGHGAVAVARVAIGEGVDYLGVATTDEGVELRKGGIDCSILLFSLPVPGELPSLIEHDLSPVAGDKKFLAALAQESRKQGKITEVHLKIDTGMGRIGCPPEKSLELAQWISRESGLRLGGVCTHLPGADMKDKDFTNRQVALFAGCVENIRHSGIDPGVVHAANSGAIIDSPGAYFSMVRPGIMVYGYYPSEEQERRLSLMPVMELVTRVVFLKKVPPGTPISYGMTYRTREEENIATLPVGYADGYNRLLSNRGEVLIRGRRYPIAGRICMDQCMVSLGRDDAALYEEVILFGPAPGAPDAEEIGRLIGTIPYEVTCMVSKRVPRVFIQPTIPPGKPLSERI